MTWHDAEVVARRATYRLQLRPGFGFDEAAAVVPYLRRLGISHIYCSPYLATVPGSTHGYDVVDPLRVRDDLGGDAAFERLVTTLAEHGLGQVMDIVPHHMSIAGTANAWWWDVLTYGPRSRYASWFDIDWESPERKLRSRILLPVLGEHYGRALEDGRITVDERADGTFVVRYADLVFPLAPHSVAGVLDAIAVAEGHDRLGFLARALAAADQAHVPMAETLTDVAEAVRLVAELQTVEPELDRAVRHHVELLNGDPDRLDALLEEQHHRLARWTVGAYELDYRRFFDVDSLIALRTERRDVFDATHTLILSLAAAGIVDGVRVDHVDGLRDPAEYLDRLRAGLGDDRYVVVEKILGSREALPAWPVDGTTGYEVADLITGVLVDPDGAARLRERYVAFAEAPATYREVSSAKRRLVLTTILVSDVERLANLLVQVCEGERRWRDFTRVELRDSLVEVLVHVASYRSYVRIGADGEPKASSDDVRTVDLAVARAREARPDLDPELFDLLRAVLTLDLDGPEERAVALRFQQLSGPVVAKGDEDSAHYAWGPLLARNEVGVDPDELSVSPEHFHEAAARRQADWPRTLTCTSTHDTKRSEDVRARLAVLAEQPDAFADAVERWWAASERHRSAAGPEPALGWFVFQTLVGAHPLPIERAWPYVLKAIREAKEHTSWLRPVPAYEAAVERFLAGVVADADLGADLGAFVAGVREAGYVNALSQVVLRLLGPGLPDTYQGTELWDDSLVDPDNRRPVDYAHRLGLLDLLVDVGPVRAWRDHRDLGLAKLAVVERSLDLRHRYPEAFDERGSYLPLVTRGERAAHALGFVRGGRVAVVVPRLPLGLGAARDEVELDLPPGRWTDVLTEATVRSTGWVGLTELTASFPVAVLVER